MAINLFSDAVIAPMFTQAQLDAKFPPRTTTAGVATQWKLSRPGQISFADGARLMGPCWAADGSVLSVSQYVWWDASFPAQFPAGLVVAGP